jgi:hypothetical protein
MKKIIILFVAISNSLFAQFSIPSGDFEQWETKTQGDASFQNPSGNWWASLNTLHWLGAPVTAEPTTDAHSGTYALKLETKIWGDELLIPGVMGSGYFDTKAKMGENLILGRDFSGSLPAKLIGYYKFTPVENDSAAIYAGFYKYNSQTGNRDTIATAERMLKKEVAEYRYFEATVKLKSPEMDGVQADTIEIVLVSSSAGADFKGSAGTTLYVDDLSFDYTTDLDEPKDGGFQHFKIYNDGRNIMIINNEDKNGQLKLYTSTGQMVHEQRLTEQIVELSHSGLKPGMYLLVLQTENQHIYTKKCLIVY